MKSPDLAEIKNKLAILRAAIDQIGSRPYFMTPILAIIEEMVEIAKPKIWSTKDMEECIKDSGKNEI